MPLTTHDLHAALNTIAPFRLAADWDNVGLLAGRPEWPAATAMLAIDLTDPVAREALDRKTNALILYHPPIFKGIKSITPTAECPTTLLPDLLAAKVSIFALHTALDHAPGGTNDVLLDAFDLASREPLTPQTAADHNYKIVLFAPAEDVDRLRDAMADAGAGVIGHYTKCSFELTGRGTFLGDETTSPAVGEKLTLERVNEIRLEMLAPKDRLAQIVRAIYANHSYEEPAFDLYPLTTIAARATSGSARIGYLKRPTRGTDLLAQLAKRAPGSNAPAQLPTRNSNPAKQNSNLESRKSNLESPNSMLATQNSKLETLRSLDLSRAAVVGDLRRKFTSITAAAGSFGVNAFRDLHSLVLTGEFKHHDALELLKRGITAIHLDHYASERPVLPTLRAKLANLLPNLRVSISRKDASPFRPMSDRGASASSR